MYDAGSSFRDRYLTTSFNGSSTAIWDISHYQLSPDEVTVLADDNQYTVASAQAFMQGLYPPLQDISALNYTRLYGISELANGTNVVAPMAGYQYQDIKSISSYDVRSVFLNGAANCPAYITAMVDYYKTENFNFLYTSTLDFYSDLDIYLDDIFTPDDLGYFDAYYIYDWLQYEALHNSSFHISEVNMTRAKILAADWVLALYSNATDPVKSIAGRSLATQILGSFYNAIQNQGTTNKLNLWFGDFAPMVSYAELAGLTSLQNQIFLNVPPMGSSYVFELVAMLPDEASFASFPNMSDMYVRFFFQNGTEEYDRFQEYALFGNGPSNDLIPYNEFVKQMSGFALSGVREWCKTCGSYSLFCPAYTNSTPLDGDNQKRGLSPVVAGVIGALVSLAVAALVFGLLMLLAGLRVRRDGSRRKSDLAGFKGSQKLASDQDLTLPKGGAGATVTTTEPDAAKGHERVGSWELREQAKRAEAGQIGIATNAKPRRPSYEDDEIHVDPYAPAVKPHDQV